MGFMAFSGVDYFLLDASLNEQELLVRRTARQFVEDRVMPVMFGQKFLYDPARAKLKQAWRERLIANHRIGDPYAMAFAAIDEAVRNAVAVGADPDRIAILDNFCWGNPNLPDRLAALVHPARGIQRVLGVVTVDFVARGILSGHERAATRRANGAVHVELREQRAFLC